jgi:adenosylmethionine-8-amino-7-oxononanoate aminotransferase
MSDLVILGTDTDAGKTTFALLWMTALGEHYDYWKPLETGSSDSALVAALVPGAVVHPSSQSFDDPVAPLLAARRASAVIATAAQIAAARPRTRKQLLIETFGSPFSPLNEQELQLALVQQLQTPCVLVASAALGAIGRTLQCLRALAAEGVEPVAVALIGDDSFAVEQIGRHWSAGVVCSLRAPQGWDAAGVRAAAVEQAHLLRHLATLSRGPEARTGLRPAAKRDQAPIVQRDRQAVWHPYTSLGERDHPLVCVGAQDEFLHLADGRRVIDAISSWWTIQHGHRHPALMAALAQASQRFDHVHFAGVTHAAAVELAELMLLTTPWPSGRVFYSDNGSTAVEVALKMAYQFWCHQGEPQRTRFIGFEGGYHGDTFGAMAVGRDPVFFGRFEPLLFDASIVPLSAEHLDAELARQRNRVAAVIVEPLVQGAGGMRMHAPDQLRALAEVTRQQGVLLIADEVMTGGGRTGPRWAHQAAGIAPDLICAGKTLAGGVLPLAATLAAPHIVEAFQTDDRQRTFFHGHSFTAHPLACAVAVANWKLPLAPCTGIEEFWRKTLLPLGELPQVRQVRICGSIAAVELTVDGGYLADVGRQLRHVCLQRGVLCRPLGNVLYTMPPLLTSADSLARIAETLQTACRLEEC